MAKKGEKEGGLVFRYVMLIRKKTYCRILAPNLNTYYRFICTQCDL